MFQLKPTTKHLSIMQKMRQCVCCMCVV